MTDTEWLRQQELEMQSFDPRQRLYLVDVRSAWQDAARRDAAASKKQVLLALGCLLLASAAVAGLWWVVFEW